jgi:hypothetical protein
MMFYLQISAETVSSNRPQVQPLDEEVATTMVLLVLLLIDRSKEKGSGNLFCKSKIFTRCWAQIKKIYLLCI